jgi:hypothetical protein
MWLFEAVYYFPYQFKELLRLNSLAPSAWLLSTLLHGFCAGTSKQVATIKQILVDFGVLACSRCAQRESLNDEEQVRERRETAITAMHSER